MKSPRARASASDMGGADSRFRNDSIRPCRAMDVSSVAYVVENCGMFRFLLGASAPLKNRTPGGCGRCVLYRMSSALMSPPNVRATGPLATRSRLTVVGSFVTDRTLPRGRVDTYQ